MAFGHQPMPTATLSGSAIFLSCGACIWQSLWLEHSRRDCLCSLWFAARERERREVRATEREPHHLSCFFRTQLSLSWELRLLAEIPTMGLSSWLSRCNTVALTVPSIARVRAFTCVFAAHLRRQATGVTLFGYGQWPPTSCCYLCSTVCGCWPALWHAFCGLGRSGAEHIKHWHGVGIWWPSLESHWRPPRGVCVAASSPTVSF